MGYCSVVLEGEGSNCFSITQLVGQTSWVILNIIIDREFEEQECSESLCYNMYSND